MSRRPQMKREAPAPMDRSETRVLFEQRVVKAGLAIREIGNLVEEFPQHFGIGDTQNTLGYLYTQIKLMEKDIIDALKQAEKTVGAAFSLDAPPAYEEMRIKMGHVDFNSGKVHSQPDVVLRVPRVVAPQAAELDEDDAAIEAMEARAAVYTPEPKVAVGVRPTKDHKATGRLVGGGKETVFELNGGDKPTNPMPEMAGEGPDPVHKGITLAGFIGSDD